MRICVFARWEDESNWELLTTVEDSMEALIAVREDAAKHIERTEQPGCPNRLFIVANVLVTSTSTPVADGKQKVSLEIESNG